MGSKKITFDESLIGREITDEEKVDEEMQMLESVGYPQKKDALYRVNPELFAKFNFLCYVDVEEMFTRNADYWQPILMQLRRELINDPTIKMDALNRKLLYSFFQSDGEDLMQDPQIPGVPQMVGAPSSPPAQYGAQVQNKMLSTAANQVIP